MSDQVRINDVYTPELNKSQRRFDFVDREGSWCGFYKEIPFLHGDGPFPVERIEFDGTK